MALIYLDSFDHYNTLTQKGWATTQSVSTTYGITTGGRTGAGCMWNPTSGSGSRTATQTLPGSYGTIIVGMAINMSVAARQVYLLLESGTLHVDLRTDSAGKLFVTRNGTQVGPTGTTIVCGVGYRYIELKVTIHDTTGSFEVRVDGLLEISASGLDTRNGGTGVVNQLRFSAGGADTFRIDDLYICDTSGSTNNDFLGDVAVAALLPSGNGTSSAFVGSDANSIDNYLLVDENPPNSDTDYVESSTVGDKDTYAMGDLAITSGTVYGMQFCTFARKTDAGTRAIKTVARLSGSETDSADLALGAGYLYLRDIRETKPGGGAWTISDVNSMEAGYKVSA